MTTHPLIQKIAKAISDKKGINVLALDVGHFSTVTDFLVIAEGNVDRHVIAIAKEVIDTLRDEEGLRPYRVDGLNTGSWVLIDYSDVIIHIFMPGMRERYQLEELWSAGTIIDTAQSL